MKITFLMIIICTLVFMGQLIGLVPNSWSFSPANLADKPYIIITSMFMHGSVTHFLLNMLGLFTFGLLLEEEIEKKWWLIIYFSSGIIANIGFMLLTNSPFSSAVGASGAIYGLIGALAIKKPHQIIYTMYGPLPMIGAAILWGIIEFISIFQIDNIAHSAHLAGMLGGILFIYLHKINLNFFITFLIATIPLVIIFLLISNFPREVPEFSYHNENCKLINNDSNKLSKILEYNCSNQKVLAISSSHKFSLDENVEIIPSLVKDIYKNYYNSNSNISNLQVENKGKTDFIKGEIENIPFIIALRDCKFYQITLIIINTTKLQEINC